MARPSRRSMKEELQGRQNMENNQYRNNSSLFKKNLEGVKFFKCKEGENVFDIIPYVTGENDPISGSGKYAYVLRIFVHKGASISGGDIICLEQTFPNKKCKCPVCVEYRKRAAKGATKDELKPLRYAAWPRTLYNVWDKKDPNAGVQVFNTSAWLLQQYLDVISKKTNLRGGGAIEAYIPFADPDEGRSIAFDRQGTDEKTKFIGVRFEDRDEIVPDEILDAAKCLDELIAIPTEEEAYEQFWGTKKECEERGQESVDPDRVARRSKYESKDSSSEIEKPADDKTVSDRKAELLKQIAELEKKSDDIPPEVEETKEEREERELEEKLAAMREAKFDEKVKPTQKTKTKLDKEPEKTVSSGGKCPGGGTFGVDIDELKECDSCKFWKDCAREQDRIERES
ncbi:MAG: hypothetical protein WC143_07480 [Eubacteriales bacterium]